MNEFHAGNAYFANQNYFKAIDAYKAALKKNPQFFEALYNLGNAHHKLGQFEEALNAYLEFLKVHPTFPLAHLNLGNVLKDMERLDEAILAYQKAIHYQTNDAGAYINLGSVYYQQGYYLPAIAAYDRALELAPDAMQAKWNKSLALLKLGRFDEAYPLYESRWEPGGYCHNIKKNLSQPLWIGQFPLQNKTLLLTCEQGLGDTVQYARYASWASNQGAKVILEVQQPLLRLAQHITGVSTVISMGEVLPTFDYYCPLMTMPMATHTQLHNIPPPINITIDRITSDIWKNRLAHLSGLKVGLVWSGGFRPNQPDVWGLNARRNIPLELLSKLNLPGVDYISLQKGMPAEKDYQRLRQTGWQGPVIHEFSSQLTDFYATAALIEHLDLVICVDTSVAHLSASLGKPTWILNRFDSCWRWLTERTDSPWYPSVRLYRQTQAGDWDTVLNSVKSHLQQRID